MAWLVPLVSLATAGVGLYQGIKANKDAKKASSIMPQAPAPLPTAPTEVSAAEKAKIDLQKRRRISVLSGGDTDKTRGQALVSETNVGAKKLLGQ